MIDTYGECRRNGGRLAGVILSCVGSRRMYHGRHGLDLPARMPYLRAGLFAPSSDWKPAKIASSALLSASNRAGV